MYRPAVHLWPALVLLLVAIGLAPLGWPSASLADSTDPEPAAFATVDSSEPRQTLEVTITPREWFPTDLAVEEYDPWQPFNEGTFAFNRQFDRFLLKPVATVWDKVLPDLVQRSLRNVLDNVGMPRRVVNNLLQGKGEKAAREFSRFLVNSLLGLGGLFDVAKSEFGIEASDEDTGQTLGVWGAEPGPYLVLPFLPPLTVRDGIGAVVDLALDPASYFAPFVALAGVTGGKAVNERSLNLELYQSVEEGAVDLYSAVRNAYLQRRDKQISE